MGGFEEQMDIRQDGMLESGMLEYGNNGVMGEEAL